MDRAKLDEVKKALEKAKSEKGQAAEDTIISCFRHISEYCKANAKKAKEVLELFPIDYITDIICYSNNAELITTYQYLIQMIINSLAGVEEAKNKLKNQARLDKDRTLSVGEAIGNKIHKKVDEDIYKENETQLFEIIVRLLRRSSSHIVSAAARDCFLGLVMTNIDYYGLNFGVKLVSEGCLTNLLDIAVEVEELKNPSSMEISHMTHSLVSAVLDRIYSCHDHDSVREKFRDQVQTFVNTHLRNPDMNDKIRAAKLFTVLLAGPAEVGNSCIGQAGMIEMIIAMASSDEFKLQKAGLDAIIAAASKKDKCQAIATQGEKILKQLKESKNEEIRLRALVGLSKVSSVGSTDASIRPFSHGANLTFARDCRAIISRPSPELNMKHHAIEALAYLSFDGDVKEELVDDNQALEALYENLTRDINSPVVYSILTIFVNLTNSYDKQDKPAELVELAKFAQQHIPQQHPMDKTECVIERVKRLGTSNLVPSLVKLDEIKSKAAKELIGRIMNALCEQDHLRGLLVQQGAVKLLLSLATNTSTTGTAANTSDDKNPEAYVLLSAQALARIGITINPELVFPGQRLMSVIKPLKRLLSANCTALQNFESLMALTNLAQANDRARAHIIGDNGFSLIEALMFEEHVLVRRAAVQCVVNLIRDPHLISLYEAENDRVKYLVILCQEDDLETIKAASGALAMLCQVSEKSCERIFSAKQWLETLIFLLSSTNIELVHRAVVIVNCLVCCDNKNCAERIFETQLFEVLLALTLPEVDTIPDGIKTLVKNILKVGKQRKLISDLSKMAHIKIDDDTNNDYDNDDDDDRGITIEEVD